MKMNRFVAVLIMIPAMVLCGCGVKKAATVATPGAPAVNPTAQLVASVQKVEAGLKIAQATLPTAQILLNDLQLLDADAYAVVAPFVGKLPAVYASLIAACDTYVANPGSTTYQAIVNAFADFSGRVNSATLAIAGIKNSSSQAKAQAVVALTGTAVALIGAFVQVQAAGN